MRTASEILGKPASATSNQIDLDKCINEIKRGREDTRRFLCLLDPGAHDFTFQTFDDNRCNGHDINGRLARSTSDRAEILQIYELGAGVYVTVNETDLTGRKSENIKRIRAIWQEDDHGHGGPFPPRSVIDTRSKGTGGKSRPVVGDRRVGAASLCTGYHPLRSRSDRRPQKA